MTSGQLGELTVVLALAMALVSGYAFLITSTGKKNLFNLGVIAYKFQIVFALVASAWLFYLFFSYDFSIEYVYGYSSSDLPFFYLVSSFWAGQEGTYLLWLFLSSLFGLLIIRRARQYTSVAMTIYAVINLFLILMLMIVSPFKQAGFTPPEGAGLNPLLQDFWMVIHPPVMFFAYAMAGVPFAIALAAVIKRDYTNWLKITFPIVIIVSFLLLAANAMGGYWAYKTLGWGGYWAWDPVENTSFVPWMFSLALIHGMLIEKTVGSFRRANLLMAFHIFFVVVYGTFLTRSGVLADFSVHSFVDLGANAVLIGFVLLVLLGTDTIFIIRHSRDIVGRPFAYNIFSREFILFVGMVLLFVFGLLVLIWSSLPLLTKYILATPAAAEIETYNSFAFPMAIIVALFMTLSFLIVSGSEKSGSAKPFAVWGAVLSVIAGLLLYLLDLLGITVAITAAIYLFVVIAYAADAAIRKKLLTAHLYGLVAVIIAVIFGVRSVEYLVFFGAAATAVGAHIGSLIKLIPGKLRLAGAQVSHFGFGIMLIGILASSGFSRQERLVLPRGEEETAFNHTLKYNGLAGSIMHPDNKVLLTMSHSGNTVDVRPGYFYARRLDGIMKKPYIKKTLSYDLYLAPMDIQELNASQGLYLKKEESQRIENFNIKFIDFDMIAHDSLSGMAVGARLEIAHDGIVDTINPIYKSTGSAGVGALVKLYDDSEYEVRVERVLAGEGAVILAIPGLIEPGAPDQLILDVSRKPGINLLWLGVILACLGLVFSVQRRWK